MTEEGRRKKEEGRRNFPILIPQSPIPNSLLRD
jgi:hypothetical protein